jgi:two-component system sensor histidine kinase and response regulator WspE
MMDLFRTEVETQAAVLNDGLLSLENEPGALDGIEPMMRAAHSIKGAARIVSLDPAVTLAHAMEDCFVAVRDGRIVLDDDAVDTLLHSTDLICRMSRVPEPELPAWLQAQSAEVGSRIASLEAIPRRSAGAGPPAVSPAEKSPPANEPSTAAAPPPGLVGDTESQAEARDRVVRVTAENLDRLMGLAGESLVEARCLQPFSNSLMQLKKEQAHLSGLLDTFREAVDTASRPEDLEVTVTEACKKMNECQQSLARSTISKPLPDVRPTSRTGFTAK